MAKGGMRALEHPASVGVSQAWPQVAPSSGAPWYESLGLAEHDLQSPSDAGWCTEGFDTTNSPGGQGVAGEAGGSTTGHNTSLIPWPKHIIRHPPTDRGVHSAVRQTFSPMAPFLRCVRPRKRPSYHWSPRELRLPLVRHRSHELTPSRIPWWSVVPSFITERYSRPGLIGARVFPPKAPWGPSFSWDRCATVDLCEVIQCARAEHSDEDP